MRLPTNAQPAMQSPGTPAGAKEEGLVRFGLRLAKWSERWAGQKNLHTSR